MPDHNQRLHFHRHSQESRIKIRQSTGSPEQSCARLGPQSLRSHFVKKTSKDCRTPFFFFIVCVSAGSVIRASVLRIQESLTHRVGRESAKPFLQASELGLPHPLTRRRVCTPPPFGSGGGDTLACGTGSGGVPIRTRGQTLWYGTLGTSRLGSGQNLRFFLVGKESTSGPGSCTVAVLVTSVQGSVTFWCSSGFESVTFWYGSRTRSPTRTS